MAHAKSKSPASGVVYTTGYESGGGRMCPQCLRPMTACVCGAAKPKSVGDGVARVSRETKGRGGKSVSVISGLPLAPAELEKLCTQLKKRCGTGGTVKDGSIEIQGEHRDTLLAELTKLGFQVKRGGG